MSTSTSAPTSASAATGSQSATPDRTRSRRASVPPGRRTGWWNVVLMHDLGLFRLNAALRMLVCVPAGLTAGFLVALLVGLPVTVGLMIGALPAFLTCFIVTDDRAGREAARSAATIVPFVLALFGSLALHEFRVLELSLMVGLLFLQFYAHRFGVWAADAAAFLFAAYLCGLLLPLPLTSIEALAAVAAASLAVTIAVRAVFFRPDGHRSLVLTRRAVAGWSHRVIVSSLDVLVAEQPATRARRRLHHRLDQVHDATLVADGLLSRPGSGLQGAAAEQVHRLLFDLELTIDGIGRVVERFADERLAPATRHTAVEALLLVRDGGGRAAARAADTIDQWMLASRDAPNDAATVQHPHPAATDDTTAVLPAPAAALRTPTLLPGPDTLLPALAALLRDLQRSADQWTDLKRSDGRSDQPFESSIGIVAGRVVGAVPVLNDTLASGGMTGFWGRWRISAPLRTALQAAIAVAIVEPLALWLGGDRFYWGVIGVMVILAGTNSTHERVRKVVSRGVGTVAGGVLGILAVDALGTTHVWLSLALIVVALAVGVYWFASSYWVWVVCLVVAICQVYAFAGQFEDALLPLRLAENMLGAGVAVLVSVLVLPVATGAIIRSAERRHLLAVRAFVSDVELVHSRADELPQLRADARAIDQANAGLDAVMKPLVTIASAVRYRRDDETRTLLHGIAGTAREIAARAGLDHPLSAEQAQILARTVGRITASIDALVTPSAEPAPPMVASEVDSEVEVSRAFELPGELYRLAHIESALDALTRLHGGAAFAASSSSSANSQYRKA